ncbi:MAG: phospholipase [Thermoanaerobaculia bacterium]|nr:phospholipase [Thermoanaerobaculia bacterium]
MTDPNVRTIATTLHGRYLLEHTGDGPSRLLLVGFHGYAQNAHAILEPLRAIAPAEATLVAVQGLHRFYSRSQQQVVASWMTREDRELMLADNLEYAARVIAAARAEATTPDARTVFVGFSQGATMAWRAAAENPAPVIALGGDIPPELTPAALAGVPSALIGGGSLDEWYTRAKYESDLARLANAGCPAEGCAFDGGHEWAAEFIEACQRFVNRLAGTEQDPQSSV